MIWSSRLGLTAMGQLPIQWKDLLVKKLHKKPRTPYTKDSQTGKGNRNIIRNLRIYIWNIKTIFKSGSMNVIINKITKYNLNIVVLQEIKWPGNGSFKHKETTIFYSGCEDSKHAFGVGFMLNNRLLENVKRFEAINERICFICLRIKKQSIIILSCHGSYIITL